VFVHPVAPAVRHHGHYLLHKHDAHAMFTAVASGFAHPLVRFQRGFEAAFERFRVGYPRSANAGASSPYRVRDRLRYFVFARLR